MQDLTISNLDDALASRLHTRAALHGQSVEDEARDILLAALSPPPPTPANLGAAIHALFKPLGGLDLEPVSRELVRDSPDFYA